MLYLLLVHVSGADRAKHIPAVDQAKHERQKHVTTCLCFSNSPHARFTWVRVCHDDWCTHQHLLNFLFGNPMLPALRPVAIIPVKSGNIHKGIIYFCVYNCNLEMREWIHHERRLYSCKFQTSTDCLWHLCTE